MNILITGTTGFLGRHLAKRLMKPENTVFLSSKKYDLRLPFRVKDLFRDYLHHAKLKPDILYHLAADVGGIEYNLKNPASIYYNNVMMNTLLINKACQVGVKKLVFVSSVCIYPFSTRLPIGENSLWQGDLEGTNGAYGASKLMSLVHLRACREQYGLEFAYPVLANLYGPGDGGFFNDDKSHVVSALVKRVVRKVEKERYGAIEVWGDGTATRDLLYVEDAAEALTKFLEVDYDEPVNIATGEEVLISHIVELIFRYTGYKGIVRYSIDKPTGQNRRCYDTSRAKKYLDWQAKVEVEEGLRKVVEWYQKM